MKSITIISSTHNCIYAVQLMQADCDNFFERVIARFGVETDELAITQAIFMIDWYNTYLSTDDNL